MRFKLTIVRKKFTKNLNREIKSCSYLFIFFKLVSFYIKQHVIKLIPAETYAPEITQHQQTYIYSTFPYKAHNLSQIWSEAWHGGFKAVECLSSHNSHHHRRPEGPRAAKSTEWRASLSLQTADLWIIHINTSCKRETLQTDETVRKNKTPCSWSEIHSCSTNTVWLHEDVWHFLPAECY